MKKFELDLSSEMKFFGKKLYRVKALISFGNVEAGETGGYVEKEENLSQVSGDAWVYGDAQVSGDAWVYGDARVYGDADIVWFSHVGTEYGTLTVYKTETGAKVVRGCFSGTIDEFLEKSKRVHSDKTHIEYKMLIDVALSRLGLKNLTEEKDNDN